MNIFIVFPPGAGGKYIRALCSVLLHGIDYELDELGHATTTPKGSVPVLQKLGHVIQPNWRQGQPKNFLQEYKKAEIPVNEHYLAIHHLKTEDLIEGYDSLTEAGAWTISIYPDSFYYASTAVALDMYKNYQHRYSDISHLVEDISYSTKKNDVWEDWFEIKNVQLPNLIQIPISVVLEGDPIPYLTPICGDRYIEKAADLRDRYIAAQQKTLDKLCI